MITQLLLVLCVVLSVTADKWIKLPNPILTAENDYEQNCVCEPLVMSFSTKRLNFNYTYRMSGNAHTSISFFVFISFFYFYFFFFWATHRFGSMWELQFKTSGDVFLISSSQEKRNMNSRASFHTPWMFLLILFCFLLLFCWTQIWLGHNICQRCFQSWWYDLGEIQWKSIDTTWQSSWWYATLGYARRRCWLLVFIYNTS